jgi:hypothetical protein
MSLLEFHDVSKASGESAMAVHALDDIDLSGQPADVTATVAGTPTATVAGTLRIGPSEHQPSTSTEEDRGEPYNLGCSCPAARRAERPRSSPEQPALGLTNQNRLQASTARWSAWHRIGRR